jgi:hypothetical protein
LWIAFHPDASSMVQRHENHSVPEQGSWWWISAGNVPFSRRNLITLRTSMSDHVSASPAILQLMLGQYDWYEARSSVPERKQCSTPALNWQEIRIK